MNWRFDSMKNFLSRIGFKGDKSQANGISINGVRLISDDELASVWISDGMMKKLVSVRAEDALSQGLDFPNDKDGAFQKELLRLKALFKCKQALQWADLFGGCVILPMVDDGQADLKMPLADRRGAPVTDLRIYDRTRMWSISTSWVSDPASPYFEDVEIFKLKKLDGTPFEVHTTRLVVIKGEAVPQNTFLNDINFRWWGQSMLQPIFNDIGAYGISFQAIAHLMQECSIAKYRFPTLDALLSDGPDGEAKVYNRMELINAGKSIVRGVFLGENEEYIRENIPIDNIANALRVFQEHACAVTGFPHTRIFGSSPGGLNATGESDMQNHYDRIREYQTFIARPVLDSVFKRIGKGLGMADNVSDFEFKPLGAPSQAALVTMRATQATTDKTYIDAGVLDADEVRENRFFKRASLETTVKTAAAPEVEEDIAGAEGEPKPKAKPGFGA